MDHFMQNDLIVIEQHGFYHCYCVLLRFSSVGTEMWNAAYNVHGLPVDVTFLTLKSV